MISSMDLFFRRDAAEGGGPVVEAPRAGVAAGGAAVPAAGAVVEGAAVEGWAVDMVEVVAGLLPRLPNKPPAGAAAGAVAAADDATADDAADDAAGWLFCGCPRLPNRPPDGAADVEAGASLEPPVRFGNRLGDGAAPDVAACEAGGCEDEDVAAGKLKDGVFVVAGCDGFAGAAPNKDPLLAFCVLFEGAKLKSED